LNGKKPTTVASRGFSLKRGLVSTRTGGRAGYYYQRVYNGDLSNNAEHRLEAKNGGVSGQASILGCRSRESACLVAG
jgi:hypothetical protein